MRVVVLGAGIIGTTTAFRLVEGGHEVTVVDRQPDVGLETSFANGGLVTPATSDSWAAPGTPAKILKWLGRDDAPMLLRLAAVPGMLNWGIRFLANCRPEQWRQNTKAILSLALLSLDELRSLTEDEELDYDRNPPGLLKLFRDPYSMESAVRAADLFRELGVRAERLTTLEAIRTEPALVPIERDLSGAMLYPDDESGDAFKFTREVAKRARARGVIFALSRTVVGLQRNGDRIEAAMTDRGPVSGDLYVLALGSYSPQVARTAGLSLVLYPAKGYSITVEAKGWTDAPRIPVADDGLKAAVTPLGDSLRVAGTVEFAGFNTSLNAARGRLLVNSLAAILPHYPRGNIRHWTGLRPLTPSGRPLIGRTRLANLLVNTGHGPLGWTLAAGSARLIASMADGAPSPIDAEPLQYRPRLNQWRSRMGMLEGKVAIVTGAGSGIGRAGAILMAREGAAVVVAEINEAAGESVSRTHRADGGQAEFQPTDVREGGRSKRWSPRQCKLRPRRRALPQRYVRAAGERPRPARHRTAGRDVACHYRSLPDRHVPLRQACRPTDAEAAVGLHGLHRHGRRADRPGRHRCLHGGKGRRRGDGPLDGGGALARRRARERRLPRLRQHAASERFHERSSPAWSDREPAPAADLRTGGHRRIRRVPGKRPRPNRDRGCLSSRCRLSCV